MGVDRGSNEMILNIHNHGWFGDMLYDMIYIALCLWFMIENTQTLNLQEGVLWYDYSWQNKLVGYHATGTVDWDSDGYSNYLANLSTLYFYLLNKEFGVDSKDRNSNLGLICDRNFQFIHVYSNSLLLSPLETPKRHFGPIWTPHLSIFPPFPKTEKNPKKESSARPSWRKLATANQPCSWPGVDAETQPETSHRN